MSNRTDLLTPIGRLVQGSLYEPKTTDAENKPLIYKTGINAGQPRVEYFFAVAIAKGQETHWNQTEWGQKIWGVGQAGFPNGQANSPAFAWKITDGDSTIPNRVGKKPCDFEGYAGHWILKFSGGFAPNIYNNDGTQQLLEVGHVNLGDYVQVYGNVADNESQQQPGVYLNHSMVAFAGYGKRIFMGADPKSVGFGNCVLPPDASATPLPQGFNPAPSTMPAGYGQVTYSAAAATNLPSAPPAVAQQNYQPPAAPYPAILTPPSPPVSAPVRVMLPAANGATYEAMIAAGWTDVQLIQHGMMQP